MRYLGRGDRPQRATEPSARHRAAMGYDQANENRGEEKEQHPQVAPDEEIVTPSPPRGEEPQAEDVTDEAGGAEHGTDVIRRDHGQQRAER